MMELMRRSETVYLDNYLKYQSRMIKKHDDGEGMEEGRCKCDEDSQSIISDHPRRSLVFFQCD